MTTTFNKHTYFDYYGSKAYALTTTKAVTEDGRIVVTRKNKYLADEISRGYKKEDGYLYTKVEGVTVAVHRLVALHFVENKDISFDTVDHINENKEDNKADNLRWCTKSDNVKFVHVKENRELKAITEERKKIKEYLDTTTKLLKELQEESDKLSKLAKDIYLARDAVISDLENKYQEYVNRIDKVAEVVGPRVERDCKIKTKGLAATADTLTKAITRIGTEVKVDNVVFTSVRGAAAYIVAQELLKGNNRNVETVRKEIKRIASYEVPSRTMYETYLVEAL